MRFNLYKYFSPPPLFRTRLCKLNGVYTPSTDHSHCAADAAAKLKIVGYRNVVRQETCLSHTVPQYRDQHGGGYYLGRPHDEWLLSSGNDDGWAAAETVAVRRCYRRLHGRRHITFLSPVVPLLLTATGGV